MVCFGEIRYSTKLSYMLYYPGIALRSCENNCSAKWNHGVYDHKGRDMWEEGCRKKYRRRNSLQSPMAHVLRTVKRRIIETRSARWLNKMSEALLKTKKMSAEIGVRINVHEQQCKQSSYRYPGLNTDCGLKFLWV